jgi:hypothetical protein
MTADALRWWIGAMGLTIALSSTTAAAQAQQSREAMLSACIVRAAMDRPWLGKTLWALRDQEGGWVGAEVRNANGTHDLGPLQVNSWWVPRIAKLVRRPDRQVRHWLIHDPCFNVEAARWIFLSGLAGSRDYWKAVGGYHSPNQIRQRAYARSVARHLTHRFGPAPFRRR